MTATPSDSLFPPNTPVVQTLDGVVYTALYTPAVKRGKQHIPSCLRISITVPTEGECHLLPERFWDRVGKFLGIAQEIATDDAEFDRRCYVRSDTPAFAAAYLSDPVKRIAFLDLQRLGFPEVELKKGELAAVWTHFDPAKHGSPDLVEEAAARLVILSRNLPPPDPELLHNVASRRILGQWILWPFLILFAAISFISGLFFPPLDEDEWFLASLPLLGVTLLAFAVLSALLLRGTSTSHRAWLGLMFGAIFLLPFGSCGTVATVNGLTDNAPSQTHRALIVRKYTTRSKSTTHYKVQCLSWRHPGNTETFEVSSSEYAAVVENRSHMEVVTRPGSLGLEWIVSKRVIP
jgi:hypothetical protein